MDTNGTLTVTIPEELAGRVRKEAEGLGITPSERVLNVLEDGIAPAENFAEGKAAEGLGELADFLRRVPAITRVYPSEPTEAYWWVKLAIDIYHPLAWHAVQYLAFVLNYISLEERLPTVFRAVSPPPYLNGGPKEYLSWVIEAKIPFLDAGYIASVLKDRLPGPVEDPARWLELTDDGDGDEADGSTE